MLVCVFFVVPDILKIFTIRMSEQLSSFLVKKTEKAGVSLLCVWGKFVCDEDDDSLEIAVRTMEMTLVRKRDEERFIEVSRVSLNQHSRTVSFGECVEEGKILKEEVYKKFTTNGGPGENSIEIEEYKIEKPWLKPDHQTKLVGVQILNFINVKGIEKLQVTNS